MCVFFLTWHRVQCVHKDHCTLSPNLIDVLIIHIVFLNTSHSTDNHALRSRPHPGADGYQFFCTDLLDHRGSYDGLFPQHGNQDTIALWWRCQDRLYNTVSITSPLTSPPWGWLWSVLQFLDHRSSQYGLFPQHSITLTVKSCLTRQCIFLHIYFYYQIKYCFNPTQQPEYHCHVRTGCTI